MIICIGDGSSTSDIAAQEVAQNRSMKYFGVLDSSTVCEAGVYHTSKYDISPQQLADVIGTDVEILVLENADPELLAVAGQNSILEYMKTNSSFCAMAWTSKYQMHYGHHRICCHQTGDISSLDAVKSQMLEGEPVTQCGYCTRAEQQGRKSPRLEKTRELAAMTSATAVADITSIQSPFDYDIRTGNRCNAQCRMCCASDSHLIDKEYNKLGNTKQPVRNYTKYRIRCCKFTNCKKTLCCWRRTIGHSGVFRFFDTVYKGKSNRFSITDKHKCICTE